MSTREMTLNIVNMMNDPDAQRFTSVDDLFEELKAWTILILSLVKTGSHSRLFKE